MKHPFRCRILPIFTIGAGGLGFALRLWLYAGIDAKGLLPAGHPADYALFLLSAITVGILFLLPGSSGPDGSARSICVSPIRLPMHWQVCV